MEEELTEPLRMSGSTDKTTFRYDRKAEASRERTSPSYINPTYSYADEHLERSNLSLSDTYHTSERDKENDDVLRQHFSWSNSHLNTVRGLKNDEDIGKPSPSWLSMYSSVAEPTTPSSWKTYESSKDDPFRKTQSFGIPRHTAFSQVTEESPRYSATQRRTFSGMLVS
jgi:hypothetical protein